MQGKKRMRMATVGEMLENRIPGAKSGFCPSFDAWNPIESGNLVSVDLLTSRKFADADDRHLDIKSGLKLRFSEQYLAC